MPQTSVILVSVLSACCVLAQSQPQQGQPQTAPSTSAEIPALKTTVTVNATINSEAPAAITVLDQTELQAIPGIELDDRLRQVPGFSLFRRSSSVVANPTTQGVSLRGTSSSGASRTLLLWDGIPLNDPFGGWVYWDRIDPSYIDRVEVNRGASTSLFGDRAMGGSISLFSAPEEHDHLFLNYLAGNENTHDVSGAYSNFWGLWGLSVHSRDFTTDGYYVTPDYVRGSVDTPANLRFAMGDVRIDYLGIANRLAIHFDILAEERQNGTVLTHNSTGLGTLGVTYTHSWTNDELSVLGFHTQEQFHSTFSSVSPGRNFERLTSRQTVPVQDTGGVMYWQHHASRWNTVLGADADDTRGISYDYSYATQITARSGGTLLEHGLFGQGDVTFGPVRFFAGIRHQFTGQRDETFVSPNAGATFTLRQFRFRASGYRSFRAPTLNELYRNFRVGNVLTLANAGLVPEGLVGVEAGVDYFAERTRISFTLFHNDLNNLVDNTTLSTSPTLILRQRTNFPSALSRGLEAGIHHHWTHWIAEAGYQYADSRLATGQRIPQVPKHTGTAQLTYSAKSTLISAGIRAFSLVFDDDLNQFLLPGYTTLEFSVQQHLTKSFSIMASIDNLLDRSYLVALTPNPNTGAPRLWRVGLRWNGAFK
ncbi:MAG TPA: TonB-dependent receptor [Bryobacteraceae bacterium]|jgi:outer membrane cobalamin receptor